MSLSQRIRLILHEGPATVTEIALALKQPRKRVWAHLTAMLRPTTGRTVMIAELGKVENRDREWRGSREIHLYGLTEAGERFTARQNALIRRKKWLEKWYSEWS